MAAGEIMVRVTAAMPSTMDGVPGQAVAGAVTGPPDGGRFAPGDRVLAYVPDAEPAAVVVARAAHTVPLPPGLPDEQGAALLIDAAAAYTAVVVRGRLAPGESVWVRGPAGDVAARVAAAFGAARVVTGDAASGRFDLVVDTAGGAGSVDTAGGAGFVDAVRRLAVGGRVVPLGAAPAEVRANRLLLNNVEIVGAAWDPDTLADQWAALAPHVAALTGDKVAGRLPAGPADGGRRGD